MDFRPLRTLLWCCALICAVAVNPPASAAQNMEDEGPQNLQVFPDDMPEEQLREIMSGFTDALGVNCTHCHVREPGQFPDFASDAKPEKETARAMIRMVQQINGWHLSDLPTVDGQAREVTCITCHHGVTQPQTLDRLLAAYLPDHGVEASLMKYDSLRAEYYGTAAFDFSEVSFNRLARHLIADGDPGTALTFLDRNLEMYPNATETYLTMAEAQLQMNDRAAAIRSLRSALAIEPDNGRIQRQLNELTGQE